MNRFVLAAVLAVMCSGVAYADVRADEKTQVKFEGMLGRMLNMFGGKATRDGSVSTVTVKGDRKVTSSETTRQIVDLAEEKIYDVDIRDRSYTVTTFAELRRRMEEARKKAAEQAPKAAGGAPQAGGQEPEFEVDFDLKETGQTRAINGFDAREIVMTVVVREKGKTLEQNGGMVLTSNTWLAPKVAAMSEVADFDRRYAEKLAASVMLDAQQMAMAAAMYPMLQDAMKRFEAENVNMDGTAVLTVVRFETVAEASAEPAPAASGGSQERPTLGGLGGRLGRRILGGNKEDAAPAAPGRTTVMTMQHELLKVSPAVADADVAVPAGFKLKS
jgi:hypothetical protein